VFSGDPYHINAYIHPIYNVFYNTPYSSTSYSIYGHYELFYKPFLKIFGTSPYVIMIVVLILSFLTAFLLTRVVYKLVSNTVIRLLFPIALIAPTGVLFDSVSYMTTPHRLLWGSIILTYAIKTNKGKYYYVIGYILTALSLMWNTESGLVYIIVWSVYCLFNELDFNIKSILKRIGLCVLGIVLAIILGLAFVNIYNLIVGGSVFVKHFFYPIINDKFVENYVANIKFGNYMYMYCLYSSLAIVIYCGYSYIRNKKLNEEQIVILMNATIVFGLELYYILRPVYFAILIVYPFTLVNMSYLAEKGVYKGINIFDIRYNMMNRIISIMMFIVIGFLSLISCEIPNKYAERYDEKRYTRETIDDELEWIENTVPENAYAFGWGIDEWYGYLGRPITYTMVGTTDVLLDIKANQNVYDKLEKEANESQYVFMQAFSFSKYHILNLNYVMTDRNNLINDNYALFESKEYQQAKKDSISKYTNMGSIKIFCFDDILIDNGYLSISGYAIDDSLNWAEENDNIKIGLLDKESGKVLISDTSCVSRPDVNEVYTENDYTYSGFYSRVDSVEIDSSTEYEIVIMFKNGDSLNYIKTGYYINRTDDMEV